ncbi:MAG: hypothetical protein HN348_17845 [Proteobacteria bacterium]|jgi:aminopeptidase N|nr:hypothetical protein [Pseudomonadota bacterium]
MIWFFLLVIQLAMAHTVLDEKYKAVARQTDEALAHPKLYESPAYRTVAFCKVPVVLHMLRQRLGDEVFFAGWKKVFQGDNQEMDPYGAFATAFSEVSSEDLTPFFDDWFFRAGFPSLELTWAAKEVDGGPGVELTLRQTQAEPYQIDVEVEIELEDESRTTRRLGLYAGEETYVFALESPPVALSLDPDELALFHEEPP